MNKNPKGGIVVENPGTSEDARTFPDGSVRSYITLRITVVGYGTYKSGWRWSLHAKPQVGKDSENHIGYIISGYMVVEDPFGNRVVIEPGYCVGFRVGVDTYSCNSYIDHRRDKTSLEDQTQKYELSG